MSFEEWSVVGQCEENWVVVFGVGGVLLVVDVGVSGGEVVEDVFLGFEGGGDGGFLRV